MSSKKKHDYEEVNDTEPARKPADRRKKKEVEPVVEFAQIYDKELSQLYDKVASWNVNKTEFAKMVYAMVIACPTCGGRDLAECWSDQHKSMLLCTDCNYVWSRT